MAKFVCDFAQVMSAGDKLVEAANTLTSATTTYSSSIESDLSGWTGDAKTTFISQSKSQVEAATQKAKELNDFGEFVKGSAQKIQELDETLAAIKI